MRSLFFVFLFLFSFCNATQQLGGTFRPRALVLPIRRDVPTNLYVADIHKRTPQLPVPFVIDLSGRYLWVTCEHDYLSTTYRAPKCHSTQCSIANAHTCRTCSSQTGPGCHNNTCSLVSYNPVTRKSAPGEVAQDVLSIQSIKGSNPGPVVSVPHFIFGCAPSSILQGPLPTNTQGFAGFGRSQVSLPSQLASHFGFRQKFALCLGGNGVIFFGDGPYMMQPGVDVSKSLSTTPLIVSRQGEYLIGVRSIKINNKNVPINTTLLPIYPRGNGGTKISTVVPYTVLETSIFRAVTQFFANELSQVPRVNPVTPFGLCFDAQHIGASRMGPAVPSIDFVLDKDYVVWRMFGANLMVRAPNNAMCLAFVDGGVNHQRASIVIGAHQLEDNLLQFDLTASRLGFSSSLLGRQTTCANFNFTSLA
ncbi:Basic 7s globulin [Thalictrum thalictroides]|uniref:Basic 7s globulin n=1 Tax=Thalictrum thalictroides TaxID=46969 RepID=A0A7J6UQV6_THATH|nr:Basic 7s globulin [Thalictrum thalictroides]